jgi:hypothetical protein
MCSGTVCPFIRVTSGPAARCPRSGPFRSTGLRFTMDSPAAGALS